MSGCTVHVIVAPTEEVVLDDVQVLTGIGELELVLCLGRTLNRAKQGV